MAKLQITRASGDVSVHSITPLIEYCFEKEFKIGFHKAFREEEKQSFIYWLSWKCLSLVEDVKPFGEGFMATLANVDVLGDDESPNL